MSERVAVIEQLRRPEIKFPSGWDIQRQSQRKSTSGDPELVNELIDLLQLSRSSYSMIPASGQVH